MAFDGRDSAVANDQLNQVFKALDAGQSPPCKRAS